MRSRLLLAVVLLVAACAGPAPTPTGAARPTQSQTPIPSFSPTITPSPSPDPTPEVVCFPGPVFEPDGGTAAPVSSSLTCLDAIDAALAALPAEHPALLRIEFHLGHYCPPRSFCALNLPGNDGYVVLTFRDGTALWVTLRADSSGAVSRLTDLTPFPPSG